MTDTCTLCGLPESERPGKALLDNGCGGVHHVYCSPVRNAEESK